MAKQKDPEQTTGAGAPTTPNTTTETGPSAVAAPPKLRRRPILVLGGIALVVLGALLAAWAYLATSETSDVVALRSTVLRGEVVEAGDLVTVQVGVDPALRVVPGDQLAQVVGQRAALDLPAGSLLTQEGITEQVVPGAGQSVVGLALTPALMPGEPLRVGDRVRVVVTAGAQGDPSTLEQEPLAQAEVVGVASTGIDGSGGTVVTVLVDEGEATSIAQYAAAGRVAIVLDSREN